jgi:hypothetical protein
MLKKGREKFALEKKIFLLISSTLMKNRKYLLLKVYDIKH